MRILFLTTLLPCVTRVHTKEVRETCVTCADGSLEALLDRAEWQRAQSRDLESTTLLKSQGLGLHSGPRHHVHNLKAPVAPLRSMPDVRQHLGRHIWRATGVASGPLHHIFRATISSGSAVKESGAVQSSIDQGKPNQEIGVRLAEGTVVSNMGRLTAVRVDDDAVTVPQHDESSAAGETSTNDLVGKLVRFPDGAFGVVIAQRPPVMFVYSDSDIGTTEGVVQIMNTLAQIDFNEEEGVIKCFGQSLPLTSKSNHAMFAPIPTMTDIDVINAPMLTGTTVVDALTPIGKGQNMLLVGSDLSEMRGVALSFIKQQCRKERVQCVYAATKDRDTLAETFQQAGILDQVHLVAAKGATENHNEAVCAAEATAVVGAASALAESFATDDGKDALLIVDTIDSHKAFWDATNRVLVDLYGMDAVSKSYQEGGASSEMRAFYSSLIQRAANYKKEKGGGSVTLLLMTTIPGAHDDKNEVFTEEDFLESSEKVKARIKMLVDKKIPLTAATLRKIEIPAPSKSEEKRQLALQHVDELISMSDGQVWLDKTLSQPGQKPAMAFQESLSRVGVGADIESRALASAIRRVVEGLRLDLAQALFMDSAEPTEESIKQIRKKDAWLLAMQQDVSQGGRTLSESCVALLAAQIGALNNIVDEGSLAGTEKGQSTVKDLLDYVWTQSPAAMKDIDESLDISNQTRADLEDKIRSFFRS
eukprot:gnl/MRDRNA2_/MRDRNA2_158123_c0_seq1.p1 gnl/MRDRNA2_/MRDRNA2_158123_c0~~gnl/MRDRNA2_/MRDRNA2_158123_c0_seq1.p1  ORF type:complete len:705 (+),score=142.22 gnl/MRDRNA2_/MRDRNA2_158123_c0_seq1:37-2151(+)